MKSATMRFIVNPRSRGQRCPATRDQIVKFLGVGLSKTGTTSLHHALTMIGLKCIHYDRIRLNDILEGTTTHPNFRRYDDVDAVTDLPSAFFYRELLDAYPKCQAILTTRDVDEWWRSVEVHMNRRYRLGGRSPKRLVSRAVRSLLRRGRGLNDHDRFRARVRSCVYGSTVAEEFLYKKKFLEHNARVQAEIPGDRLLVMDITAGDGWETLCPFLNVDISPEPFPHEHKTDYEQS